MEEFSQRVVDAMGAAGQCMEMDIADSGAESAIAIAASLLGSVSHFALNHSQIPVLIVHADGTVQPRSARRTRTMEVWPTQSLPSSSAASSSIAPS